MWHRLEYVAEHNFLDVDIIKQVAADNDAKLSIVDGEVCTAHADELIRLVEERQGNQTEAIRQREILRQYPENTKISQK
jgi:hypothetical protein